MHELRTARRLAWILVSAIGIPCLSVGAVAAPRVSAPIATKSVLIFPMESAEGVTDLQVAEELNVQLRDALSTRPNYSVVVYSERLPAVQRLVAMQPEKKTLTGGPFGTDEKGVQRALTLGRAMSADVIIVGTVSRYTFNGTAGTADIVVSAESLDGMTGNVLQNMTVAGRGVGKGTLMEGVSEAAVQRDAVKDAIGKMMKSITGEEYREVPQSRIAEQPSKSKSTWLPVLLLSLGVGLLLGGHGSSGGGQSASSGGTETPPPPPL